MRITDTGPIDLPLDRGIARELPRIADEWVDAIRDRTRRGVAADGSRFPARKDGSPSTLHQTGAMLAGFGVQRIDSGGFRLAPDRKQQHKALHHQRGSGNAPRRAWVGVEADLIEAARQRVIEAAIPRNRR